MTERKARTNKLLVLGVDGMDPRLTSKYVKEGKMPNTKKFIESGSTRDDLMMLGGSPTVTPPMWTTLSTGAYANVHGITGFFRCGQDIDKIAYNLDSRNCKAEQIWNATAEAGYKTLVFHWPGSSWPPTSDSENLFVIDGAAPGPVGSGTMAIEQECLTIASEKFDQIKFLGKHQSDAVAACVITGQDSDSLEAAADDEALDISNNKDAGANGEDIDRLMWKEAQLSTNATEIGLDKSQSIIKPASGWANAPEDAKELVVLLSKGFVRRPCLVLKNEQGIYDRVAMYKKKSDSEPLVVLPLGEMVYRVKDDCIVDDEHYEVIRDLKLVRLAEDGSEATIYASWGYDTNVDAVYHPKRLFQELKDNVGTPAPVSMVGCQDDMLITECMLEVWNDTCHYQAEAMKYLIEAEDIDVVFSHQHSIDLQEHMFIKHMADRPFNRNPVELAQKWMENVYIQTDNYIGEFLPLLDEGWTILIVSDHAQVAPKYELTTLFDMNSSACSIDMVKLGYTVLKTNADGKTIGEVDWTKTRAVMQREGHIYLNVKGRNKHTLEDGTVIDGIVDPADKYDLEGQIITDLYGLKSKESGQSMVAVALRNKDAVLLGQGGPEAGDICCWIAEGYNYDHADCLSTCYGESDTSVSPIFIAAGKGVKKGVKIDRLPREIDVAPTCAALLGTRMPAQCEGAPVYPIFEEEF